MPLTKVTTNCKGLTRWNSKANRLYSRKNINDENDSFYSEESYKEGEELARELYELVRIREFKEKLQNNESQMQIGFDSNSSNGSNSSRTPSLTADERIKREKNPSSYSGRREVINSSDNTLSAGLFTQSGKSAYFTTSANDIYATSNNAKRKIIEQEFSLVNMATNERTILLQAAVCLIVLVFYLYIGFIGGITSGSSFNMEDMMIDFEMDYEQVESNAQSLWI